MERSPVSTAPGPHRAVAFLGVEQSEQRSVGLMAAHSFFMGCATVFFETAASASFLARFESSFIPWVYLAAAAVNMVTGSVYARVQKRASFARLMKGTLWLLLGLVVVVRVGFAASNMAWVAFAGLVSYRIISSLTDLEYWAVASRIYDVRQAKRLFGLVGTGEVIARIAGSFCVPVLVKLGGVSNLMVISAGALVICLFLVGLVMRGQRGIDVAPRAPTALAPAPTLRSGLREIVASPYLSVVVAVAVLATFGKYFVDFAFLAQVSTVSRGEEELASLLGLFSGLTQTLSLLTRLFVSRPLLARLGVRAGVLVLPIAHAACSLLTILVGLFGPAPAVFWLVIANQGIYKTLKHPIDNASFKVLYQPLRSEQRLSVQIAVEVIFSPAVVGVAGAVMLLFSTGMRYDPVRFSFVLLAVFVAWAFTARAAGRGYARKLVEMLRRRLEGDFVFTVDDATTLSVLRARLASDDPAEVCVALDLLEKAAPADLADLLLAETSNASAAVRRYAIERLLALRPETLHGIRQRISIDPEPSVRNVAMAAVGASGTADAARELVACLDDPDASVRRAALTVLFRLPIEETRALAVEAVTSLAQSARAADRALAAAVAGTNGLRELVVQLLSDANFSVRRAAIQAAGTLRDPTLRPALLENLLTPRFAQAAGLALAAEGDVALPSLEALLDPASETLVARRVVYVLRTIGSPAAMRALAARLDFPEVTVRGGILFALDRLGYVARSEAEREHVSLLMREEITDATWALAARRDLGKEKRLEPVRAALQSEVADARLRVLHLLAFVHDPVAIHRAALHLADRSKNKRAFAHEVLDLTLDGDERALVLPLVDEAPLTERLRRLEAADLDTAPQTAAQRMAEIARRAPRRLRRFTADVALWAAGHATRTARGDGAASEEKEMLLIEKVIVLKTVAMFERTADELVAEIASIVEVIEHRTGDVIFEKGDAGESMYIVVSGSVRVYDGEKTLRVLGEREIFGELALLDPEPRSASVAAAEDTRLFRLDGDLFSQLMAANVDIVRGVLHILCERLRATSATTGRP